MTTQETLTNSSPTQARVGLALTFILCGIGLWTSVISLRAYGLGVFSELSAQPEALLIAALRVVVFGLSLWIGIATLLAMSLQLAGLPDAAARVARFVPGVVRSTLRRAVGVGLVGTLFLQTSAGASTPPAPGIPPTTRTSAVAGAPAPSQRQMRVDPATGQRWPVFTEEELRQAHVTSIALTVDFAPKDGQATPIAPPQPTSTPVAPQSYLPRSTIAATQLTKPTESLTTEPVPSLTSPDVVEFTPGAPELKQHTVVPGEHFWSIARNQLKEIDPTATETGVATYARLLIETNRATLIDPSNPDLLMVGTTLTLPPIP